MISLAQARRAKLRIKNRIQAINGFAGIGISKIGTDYCVQVYVNNPVAQYRNMFPQIVCGVKVILVEIGTIEPRLENESESV